MINSTCTGLVFFTGLVHPTLNSPRSLMRFAGEKRTLIAHLFSNLVPEIATIVELSYSHEFSLARWKMHNGALSATFHRISTIIVSPAISVL